MPKIQCPHCLYAYDPNENAPFFFPTDYEKKAAEALQAAIAPKELTLEEFEKLHTFHEFRDELEFCGP